MKMNFQKKKKRKKRMTKLRKSIFVQRLQFFKEREREYKFSKENYESLYEKKIQ